MLSSDGKFRMISLRSLLPLSRFSTAVLSESQYHKISDALLEDLYEQLEAVNQGDIDDITLSLGVLRVDVTDGRTYIINKQTPNKQIWMSSPISGPFRFDFDTESRKWVGKEGKCMLDILSQELTEVLQQDVNLIYDRDLL